MSQEENTTADVINNNYKIHFYQTLLSFSNSWSALKLTNRWAQDWQTLLGPIPMQQVIRKSLRALRYCYSFHGRKKNISQVWKYKIVSDLWRTTFSVGITSLHFNIHLMSRCFSACLCLFQCRADIPKPHRWELLQIPLPGHQPL